MKVAIIGATHGNEKTGSWLIEKWKKHPELLPKEHDYFLAIGNPKAYEQNLRYVDFDLNRSFNDGNTDPNTYEFHRANELKAQLAEWSKGEDFFLIDLHTTTSNMGATLILSEKQRLNAYVLKQVKKEVPHTNLVFSFYDQKNIYLNSLSPFGVLIEVGPAPQNLLLANAIDLMEESTYAVLKALPQDIHTKLEQVEVEGFLEGNEVTYPEWTGEERNSHIHPSFQNQDFKLLKKGDPIFITNDGTTIDYEDNEPTYATFINEAAYYVKGFAFTKNTLVVLEF